MRRVLFSLLVVGVVFAIAYGAAASLTVDGGFLQAGDDTSLQGPTTGVTVSYQLRYDNNEKAFVVDSVIVWALAPAYAGKTVAVQLTQDGSAIASGTKNLPSDFGGGPVQVNLSPKAKAEYVTGVHVAIYTP